MIIEKTCTPQSNDERMAQWSWKYFSAGYHRDPPQIVPEVTYSEGENYARQEMAAHQFAGMAD